MTMSSTSNGTFSSLNNEMEVKVLGLRTTWCACKLPIQKRKEKGIWVIYSCLLVIDIVSYHFCSIYAGKLCIEVTPASKIAFISEELCIGCGICVKVSNLQLEYFLVSVLLFNCIQWDVLIWLSDLLMQKCPFEAIQIINLPKDLDKDTTHRYGPNTFKLHRLIFHFFS